MQIDWKNASHEIIHEEWVARLLSGNYEQGLGELCNIDGQYCCLGVLQKMYYELVLGDFESKPNGKYLRRDIAIWAGINDSGSYNNNALSYKNDHGNNFEEIAEIIKQERESLLVCGQEFKERTNVS